MSEKRLQSLEYCTSFPKQISACLKPYSLLVDTHLVQTPLNPEAKCLLVNTQQVMRHDRCIIWSAWGLNNDTPLPECWFPAYLDIKQKTAIPVMVIYCRTSSAARRLVKPVCSPWRCSMCWHCDNCGVAATQVPVFICLGKYNLGTQQALEVKLKIKHTHTHTHLYYKQSPVMLI